MTSKGDIYILLIWYRPLWEAISITQILFAASQISFGWDRTNTKKEEENISIKFYIPPGPVYSLVKYFTYPPGPVYSLVKYFVLRKGESVSFINTLTKLFFCVWLFIECSNNVHTMMYDSFSLNWLLECTMNIHGTM